MRLPLPFLSIVPFLNVIRFSEIYDKAQAVAIPRGRASVAAGEARMRLVSTSSPLWSVVDVTPAEVAFYGDYAAVSLKLPREAPRGEWKYTFTIGGVVVSEGLAIVGELPTPEAPVRPADGGVAVQYDPMK